MQRLQRVALCAGWAHDLLCRAYDFADVIRYFGYPNYKSRRLPFDIPNFQLILISSEPGADLPPCLMGTEFMVPPQDFAILKSAPSLVAWALWCSRPVFSSKDEWDNLGQQGPDCSTNPPKSVCVISSVQNADDPSLLVGSIWTTATRSLVIGSSFWKIQTDWAFWVQTAQSSSIYLLILHSALHALLSPVCFSIQSSTHPVCAICDIPSWQLGHGYLI